MKTFLFILGMLLAMTLFAQEDSSKSEKKELSFIKYFSDLKLDYLIDKPVDSFITKVGYAPIKLEVLSSNNSFYQGLIKVYYMEGIYANVYVIEFQRVNPNGICKKRNLRLARSEYIAAIHILNEVACLQGCR